MSASEAFDELRRGAGVQFDAELLETFIKHTSGSDENRNPKFRFPNEVLRVISQEVNALASAFSEHNMDGVVAHAERLTALASQQGLPEISELASQLQETAANDCDLVTSMRLTTSLLSLCKEEQASHLQGVPVS